MWSRTTRELLEIVKEDPQAEAELRERFGVAENQSLVEVINEFYYRKKKEKP
jgi:predicted CopG family antitoxin